MKLNKKLLSLCGMLALNGCNTIKDTLGLTRSEPDEFNLIDRHHLTVPPRYNLRPPIIGQENPAVINPQAQARQSITGSAHTEVNHDAKSAGDKALLNKLSQHPSDKDIRSVIAQQQENSKKTVNSRITDLSKPQADNKEVIDPHAEYEEHTGHAHPSKYLEDVN